MIVCFSGCGNSAYVAGKLAALLGESEPIMLREPLFEHPEIAADAGGRVVWIFPVYSWGIPPVVARFIESCTIPGADSAEHHLVMTCGDDVGMTDRQWRRLITRRRWRHVSATSVIMPNTYVLMKGFDVDSEEVAQQKVQAAAHRLDIVARTILPGETVTDVHRGAFPRFKSRIIYPWFVRNAMSPKPFHATDDCIGCGICARSCPMSNITMHDSRPAWGDNCALCLGCYHACPKHAVAYGKVTRGKGVWRFNESAADPATDKQADD